MSTKTLSAAIFIAVVLGLTLLLVLNRQKPGGDEGIVQPGERLLELDSAKVKRILIAPPGPPNAGTLLEREADASGRWTLTTPESSPGAAGGGRPRWRVDPTRVRNLLSILGAIQAVAKPEPGAKIGDAPTVVTLGLDGGSEIVIKLAARVLGGQGLVEVASPQANVPAPSGPGAAAAPPGATATGPVVRLAVTANTLHNLFQSEGPRMWRDTSILPGVLSEASRVRLVSDKGSLALAKVNGRWSMTEPLAVAADAGAVQRLLTTLEGLQIKRFFDEKAPDGAKVGLDSPKARVIVESDRRSVGGEAGAAAQVSTQTRELIVGDVVDVGGKTLYATIDGGATLVAIDAGPLAEIDIEPTRFITRVSSGAAPADVGLLMFVAAAAPGTGESPAPGGQGAAVVHPLSMGFLRKTDSAIGGWVELRPDGAQVAQEPRRVQAINDLLKMLTTDPCATVSLGEPSGYQALGSLSLKTAGDQPLEELEIARYGGAGVAIKSGRVVRTYASVPELFGAVLGPIEPNPGKDASGKETRDITK